MLSKEYKKRIRNLVNYFPIKEVEQYLSTAIIDPEQASSLEVMLQYAREYELSLYDCTPEYFEMKTGEKL